MVATNWPCALSLVDIHTPLPAPMDAYEQVRPLFLSPSCSWTQISHKKTLYGWQGTANDDDIAYISDVFDFTFHPPPQPPTHHNAILSQSIALLHRAAQSRDIRVFCPSLRRSTTPPTPPTCEEESTEPPQEYEELRRAIGRFVNGLSGPYGRAWKGEWAPGDEDAMADVASCYNVVQVSVFSQLL